MARRSRVHEIPEKVVKRILTPFETFASLEASSGILLIIVTIIAMAWANSPWAEVYEHLIELPLSIGIGSMMLTKSLHHWVNDGLMVIFFFVVGLEIKRELAIGELSSPRKAALPMFAALGGMVCPALIYFFFNTSGVGLPGWGIPMATDIAFAVGVLTLLSRKVPLALKIFLLALAIVDDLGAVIVIALFYTENIVASSLGLAAIGVFLTVFIKYAGVRKLWVYWVLGVFVWFNVLKSGVHATVAGVILGLITPVAPLYRIRDLGEQFTATIKSVINSVAGQPEESLRLSHETAHHLDRLHNLTMESRSPLDRLIHDLHPWVSFGIMPIFAFVNAGVHISPDFEIADFAQNPIALGVILGLFLGKPIGVVGFSYLAYRFKFAQLPEGVTWRHMASVGFLAGIGFTMALFIGHLALKVPEVEMYSKLGILIGSFFSAVMGMILLATGKDLKK